MKTTSILYRKSESWLLVFMITVLALAMVYILVPNITINSLYFRSGQILDQDIIASRSVQISDSINNMSEKNQIIESTGLFFSYQPEVFENTYYNINNSLAEYYNKQQALIKIRQNFYQANLQKIANRLHLQNEELKLTANLDLKKKILKITENIANNQRKLDIQNQIKSQFQNIEILDQEISAYKNSQLSTIKDFNKLYDQTAEFIKNSSQNNILSLARTLGLEGATQISLLNRALSYPNLGVMIEKALAAIYQEPFIDNKNIGYSNNTLIKLLETDGSARQIGVIGNIDDKASRLSKIIARQNIPATITDLLAIIIEPNLQLNQQKTDTELGISLSNHPEKTLKIKPGMVLAYKGEKLSPEKKQLLDNYFQTQSILNNIPYISSLLIVIFLGIGSLLLVINRQHKNSTKKQHNKKWLLISVSLIATQLLVCKLIYYLSIYLLPKIKFFEAGASFYIMPVALAAILGTILLPSRVTLALCLISAIISSFLIPKEPNLLLYSIASNLMAFLFIKRLTIITRSTIIVSSLKLMLLNAVFIIVLQAIDTSLSQINFDYLLILKTASYGLAGGLLSMLLTMIILPLYEYLFDIKTDIKLLELSTINHPLLKDLLNKAPGTYHHSVTVGALAESGALKIGANALFCRIAGYFHDVGKIYNPNFFIENMTSGSRNLHLIINDPMYSKDIILGHVQKGVELAKKYRLGQDFIDVIQQHHGTTLISYFYHIAKKKDKSGNNINQEDFRYKGPKPQDANVALIMLADICEASVRSIHNISSEKIINVVRSVSRYALEDGQLDESGISLHDFKLIQETYIAMLLAMHHSRIEYPQITAQQTLT